MKCLHQCSNLPPNKPPSILQSARCPEARRISPEFWTLSLATSNMSNVPIRSAGTHQVIWPWYFVTLKPETHNGRERSLYSFTSCSLKSLDSLNHECQLEQMSLRQIAPAVHPRGEAQSLGDLGFSKSAPQTKCDHMDDTDYVAAVRIGKGHLFFSRSVQTSPQKCHTVAQGSSKKKKKS